MHTSMLLILFIVPLIIAYPQEADYELDRALEKYLGKRIQQMAPDDDESSDDTLFDQLRSLFSKHSERQQRQMPLECLPNVWTCGPGLPPCCPGLMCYEGNAKRGRHCVARG